MGPSAPSQGEGEGLLVAEGTPRLSLAVALGLALRAFRWLTLRRLAQIYSWKQVTNLKMPWPIGNCPSKHRGPCCFFYRSRAHPDFERLQHFAIRNR